MNEKERTLLLQQAAQLFALGLQVELSRQKLQRLVAQGVSYDTSEMRFAFDQFQLLEQTWSLLEKSYLKLRKKAKDHLFVASHLPLPCLPNVPDNWEQKNPLL